MKRILGSLSMALALSAGAAEPAKCALSQVAVWPVRLQGGLPVMEGAINGKKVGVLLDTGAYASLVTKDAARRLDLFTRDTGQYATGVGGDSRVLMTRVKELRIADATVESLRVRVVGERPIAGVDFVLGDDFFRQVDIEFDYAKGVVRLYKPSAECKNAWLAYWDPQASQLPLEGSDKILFTVQVNGRDATALLDSGASSTVLSLGLAEKVGLTPRTPGVLPASCSGGIGADIVRQWVATFDTFVIGGETIRDAHLPIMELSDFAYGPSGHDLLLGTDFLRSHHVFVSRHQGKVYFTYAGGRVFPHTPALECDERLRPGRESEARAAFDEALARDPRDARALLGRALLRWREKDLQGALADLDALVASDPHNGPALQQRMNLRWAMKDLDGALADSDAAIANGMQSAGMHASRAQLWNAKGDAQRAMQEIDAALKIDPRNAAALRLHGRAMFHAGRFEDAERDFETRMALQRSPYDALWISISRARRGADGKAVLAQWLAGSKEADWPAPVMAHLAGQLDRESLFAAAEADAGKRAGRLCEARFFVAEADLAAGRAQEGRALLEKARDECPRNFIEYEATLRELGAK